MFIKEVLNFERNLPFHDFMLATLYDSKFQVTELSKMADESDVLDRGDAESQKSDKMFTLKKWNAVAMWSWDVECDTCAICRVQVMGKSTFCIVSMSLMVMVKFSLLCGATYSFLIFIIISINRQLIN